jgi:hypothetical protein
VRSGAQILLLDQTVFTIGPESELVVDEFVYDPATSTGKMSARVAQGVFRFVSGKLAKDHPEDVKLVLPTGTLGIRGTLVAGRVDEATKTALLVLLGEGRENDTGSPPGAIEVCNAGSCVRVRSAGFGTRIGGPDQPPLEPFRVSEEELNALTQSVTDPAGWLAEAKASAGDMPDVAAGAEAGDTRSATEISGRLGAAGGSTGTNALDWLRDFAGIDAASTLVAQDSQKTIDTGAGEFDAGGGGGSGGPLVFTGPGQLTTYDDLASLVASGSQTAVFAKPGIALTDRGAYDFSLTLNLGERSVLLELANIEAPSLGISGESFRRLQSLDANAFENVPFVRESGRLAGGEGPCDGGCTATVQAFLFSANGRIADSVLQSLAIVPEANAAASVVTADPYQPIVR